MSGTDIDWLIVRWVWKSRGHKQEVRLRTSSGCLWRGMMQQWTQIDFFSSAFCKLKIQNKANHLYVTHTFLFSFSHRSAVIIMSVWHIFMSLICKHKHGEWVSSGNGQRSPFKVIVTSTFFGRHPTHEDLISGMRFYFIYLLARIYTYVCWSQAIRLVWIRLVI